MTVLITLTTAGSDSGPFNLYSNLDGFVTPFETGVSKLSLVSGYTSTLVPDYTSTVRIKSTGTCTNYVDLIVSGSSTTTTSSSTTTSTTTSPSSFLYLGTANTYASSINACANQVCAQSYYLPIPVIYIGQIIYTDAALTTTYNGGNQWIAISENCNGTYTAVQVDNSGTVLSYTGC
jgi:hypothetical protein